jgi:D-glycerate 3-kinase
LATVSTKEAFLLDHQQLLRQFIATEKLPASFETLAQTYYLPLLDWILSQRKAVSAGPLILGINGCQGSGKSTLAALITHWLEAELGWQVAVLSLDDLYLTKRKRLDLAAQVHPLLITRGVPGTHDITLGQQVLDSLCSQQHGGCSALPRFDKASDDRLPESQWPKLYGVVDTVILEGWCLGSAPQPVEALQYPGNELERKEDADGHWRQFVNQSLYNYRPLFTRLNKLIMLKAPDFGCVFQWRLLQEQKLAASNAGAALMSEAEITRFIQHYQRLTQTNIAQLTDVADIVFNLGPNHEISAAIYSQ